jgi:hypothetical protein
MIFCSRQRRCQYNHASFLKIDSFWARVRFKTQQKSPIPQSLGAFMFPLFSTKELSLFMLAIFTRKVNSILHEVSESTPLTSQSSTHPATEPTLDTTEKEPRLEVSLNWFDHWKISGSCNEVTFKKWTAKLQSPISKGLGIATGIAIGVAATVHGYSHATEALGAVSVPAPIEAPQQTK